MPELREDGDDPHGKGARDVGGWRGCPEPKGMGLAGR